jgi:hypothetical protein
LEPGLVNWWRVSEGWRGHGTLTASTKTAKTTSDWMEQEGVLNSAEAARISVMLQVWWFYFAQGLIELALICNGHTSTRCTVRVRLVT